MNSLDRGLAVLRDQGNDFGESGADPVQRLALAVAGGEAGHVAAVETGVRDALEYGGVGMHGGHCSSICRKASVSAATGPCRVGR